MKEYSYVSLLAVLRELLTNGLLACDNTLGDDRKLLAALSSRAQSVDQRIGNLSRSHEIMMDLMTTGNSS